MSIKVKKQFVELYDFLKANESKTVKSLLPQIQKMVESTRVAETVLYNKDKKPVAIFCYYHKQWEVLSEVEYGSKKSTKSGYNTMCKVGVNKWTAQQSTAEKERSALIADIEQGKKKPSDLSKLLAEIEAKRLSIDKDKMPKGYAEKENIPADKLK